MRIAIACDHAALGLKDEILKHLTGRGHEVYVFAPEESGGKDYPVYAELGALAIQRGECGAGVFICGTGAGMCITANKFKGIRAVSCVELYTARLAKEHNNANVICLGARITAPELSKQIVDEWLDAGHTGARHVKRVEMIEEIENKNYK